MCVIELIYLFMILKMMIFPNYKHKIMLTMRLQPTSRRVRINMGGMFQADVAVPGEASR